MAAECPICGKPAVPKFKPFCSRRCADIDLHSWLKEGYSIPGGSADQPKPDPDDTDG